MAESNKMPIGILPTVEETDELPPAGISPQLADPKKLPADNVLKTPENSGQPADNVQPEADESPPTDSVPKLTEPKELSPDIISEASGHVAPAKSNELPAEIASTLPGPQDSPVDHAGPPVTVTDVVPPADITPKLEEPKKSADNSKLANWVPRKRIPKYIIIRRWMTVIDPKTGEQLQLQHDEEIENEEYKAKELPKADNVLPEPSKPSVDTIPVKAPPKLEGFDKLLFDMGVKKAEPIKFPAASEPCAMPAGRTRTRTRMIAQMATNGEPEMGCSSDVLTDKITTMKDLAELSFDLDKSTSSSSHELPVDLPHDLPPKLPGDISSSTPPQSRPQESKNYMVVHADLKNVTMPKYALAYYGPMLDFENDLPFDTVHHLACKMVTRKKMAYSKIRDSVTEAARPTLPIPFKTVYFRIADCNNWLIELIRDEGQCLAFQPIYDGQWESERDKTTLPGCRHTNRTEIASLQTEYTPEAGFRMLKRTLNTILKMFTIENVHVIMLPNFGVLELPVWDQFPNFESVFIHKGRNLTPEELGFILKLKTKELTILPKVDPEMDYEGELQYDRLVLEHADWLPSENGLLQLHSKEVKIGNVYDFFFTPAQVRDYIHNWFGDDYDTFRKMRVAVNTEDEWDGEVIWRMIHGFEVIVLPMRHAPRFLRVIVIRPCDRKRVLLELGIDDPICKLEVLDNKPIAA